MTELEKQIVKHNNDYRFGKPTISDAEYDLLFEQLPEDSVLLKSGIIDSVPSERKEKLPIPMFSMDKLKTIKELKDWIISLNLSGDELLVFTGKYDGISLCSKEPDGKAWTRGDGFIGQNSDTHFKNMLTYDICDTFEYTFGEAIMPNEMFLKYKDKYANPRNLAGGLLNSSKIDTALGDVVYMRYGCNNDMLNKDEILNELNKFNFLSVPFALFSVDSILKWDETDMEGTLDSQIYQAVSEVFLIDGIVIEVNSAKLRKKLGRERNNNPAYARALKLSRWQKGDTVDVTGVTLDVSKQGCLKPVINVIPTSIGGVTISNVTGYNMRYIKDNNIGIGASIEIIRSGDVIPKHIKTLVDGVVDIPTNCPFCGSQTTWDNNNVELECSNYNCPERRVKKLVYFFEKAGIDNFAENSIRFLFNKGYETIKSIMDIDVITLSYFEGWGVSSASKLINQFKKLRKDGLPFADLLQALDVFEGKIGSKIAQKIFDELYIEGCEFLMEDLIKVDGVSELSARAFYSGLVNYTKTIPLDIPFSYIVTPKKDKTGNSFDGWSVCFSGVRDKELEGKIESEGGTIVSGVSSKTTHLIVKDLSDKVLSSSKCVKASKLGVKIIPINDLK